jgi:hypothetical protein
MPFGGDGVLKSSDVEVKLCPLFGVEIGSETSFGGVGGGEKFRVRFAADLGSRGLLIWSIADCISPST